MGIINATDKDTSRIKW